ncbi:methyltransferase domain-containing protein [Rhodoblastus sp.]|uniref:methyltransferase domain-containing protein n=1 Tax=Rhodoblastus sp. TaxID=1962975 RepID=UPI0035B36A91
MIVPGKLSQTYNVNGKHKSLSAIMRTRRFKSLNDVIERILKKKDRCSILDVGGSEYYWNLDKGFLSRYSGNVSITITNIDHRETEFADKQLFKSKIGDATDPRLYEGNYDFIHSNSVIEHVGNWDQIRAMASNIVNSGLPYYVQTPNYWFPVEPHFRTVGFQWLPLNMRAKMLLSKQRGFRAAESYDEAMAEVESIHLLTFSQMRLLFPNAEIARERLWPFTKSMMAIQC